MPNEENQPLSLYVTSIVMIIVLTGFYAWCGYQLPDYTAPDEITTAKATRFYLENKRLAVLPQDEDIVPWTSQGGTRVMRQPFNYLFAAVVAKVNSNSEDIKSFRLSSGILTALALALILISCYHVCQSLIVSLSLTLALGFTPQLIYLASYHNDDTGAFLAGAAALLTLVLLSSYQLNRRLLLFCAAVVGFILLNKPTVYSAIPVIGLYLLYQMIRQRYRIRTIDIFLCISVVIAAGGWWVLSNVIVYGIGDPFQHNIAAQMIEQHATVGNSNKFGTFQRYGMRTWEFLVNGEYWDALLKNSIANFGFLELRSYPFIYSFYSIQFIASILGFFYLATAFMFNRQSTNGPLLIASSTWLAFTYFLYAYFVVYVDIQLQGKYILPAAGVLVLFSALLIENVGRFLGPRRSIYNIAVFLFFGLGSIAIALLCIFTTLKNYYVPDELNIKYSTPITISPDQIRQKDVSNFVLSLVDKGLALEATETDPQILLDPAICKKIARNALIEIDLTADSRGQIRVYFDIASGFNNTHSRYLYYAAGRQELKLNIDLGSNNQCRELRIDPVEKLGRIILHKITITPYEFKVKYNSDI